MRNAFFDHELACSGEPTAPGAAGGQPPLGDAAGLDPRALDNLRHLQHPGDPDVLRQVVEAFLESCPPLLTTLRDTVTQRQSMAAMQVAAHTLKSSCAMVGAVRLAGLCRELEGLAEAAWHAGERIVKEIESAYPVVCEALMEECRKDGFPVADT